MSTEYWLISAPGDKTCQQTWEKMNHATAQSQLCTNYKFHIPDLKVIKHLSNKFYLSKISSGIIL